MSDAQEPDENGYPVRTQGFPPRRDFSSLAVKDLLEARDAYHVHLSSLENVVATAIGRYRIQRDDWYAEHPPGIKRPLAEPYVPRVRTLANSVVRPWSWPAVLVFVREWKPSGQLAGEAVPRALYLPDGRVVPTCVILARPDESPLPAVPGPAQVSGLLGGGYAALRNHQGTQHLGTFGCLVIHSGHDAGMAIIKLIHKTQTRLQPATIIDADDPSLSQSKRAKALWADPEIQTATIAALADSVKLLANLWTSAWREGGGENIPQAELKRLSEASLQHLYRSDEFLPAFSLQAMAEELGDRFEA